MSEEMLAGCVLAGVFGLVLGSFLNVVIHRLPVMMEREWADQCAELQGHPPAELPAFNLAAPRSRCPGCANPISARDNIPVISYLLLRGQCRHCGQPISPRYPLVELLTAILFVSIWLSFGPTLVMLGAMGFAATLICLAFIDFDTQLLPDALTLPLLWAGLALNLVGTFTNLSHAVIGAMAGYLILWLVFWGFKLATGKDGMGYGDFKLLAAIGAWLGWQVLPVVILFSSLIGALVGGGLILLTRQGRNVPIPFGPYLAAAGLAALFWGKPLTTWLLVPH